MANLSYAISYRGNKRALLNSLRRLPSILAGSSGDNFGIGRAFMLHLAHGMFERIHDAYLIKAAGGTDELGQKWKPLAQSTIEARPLSKAERKTFKIRASGLRKSLTAAQDRQWKGVYATTFNRMVAYIGIDAAKERAAKMAWAVVKKAGAKTRSEKLINRVVLIMILSERLLKSLTPGTITEDSYQKPREQILRVGKGSVTLGTSVPYAGPQHEARPFWPLSNSVVEPWTREAADEALETVHTMIARIVNEM